MNNDQINVAGGVDTHSDGHVAAVIDDIGRILGTASFPVSAGGYQDLLAWMGGFGKVRRVGVEGTGTYGAGLTRFMSAAKVEVIEVNRPNRQLRRRRGKSDATDAEAAARAALNGEATAIPKSGDGPVEAIRVFQVTRRSAMKARTQAANQIRAIIVTAPEPLRERLYGLNTNARVKVCARFRPGTNLTDPISAVKRALQLLALRHQALSDEITELDAVIAGLCAKANPALLAATGVGPEVAATLLTAAGDNPDRMRSQGSFAALCGASPVEASSGKTIRHRLNQGGNRQANNALWWIAFIRLSCDDRTKAYAARRRSEGKSDREIIRCLKRYIAREIFRLLVNPPQVPHGPDLRRCRRDAGVSLESAAETLGTWPTRLSGLERGLIHDAKLATKYQHWLETQ